MPEVPKRLGAENRRLSEVQQADDGYYSMSEERQTGWLIEEFINGNPRWLRAYRHQDADPFLMSPTFDASEGLRFARKEDAETFLHNLIRLHPCWSKCFVTDHEWIAP